MQISIPGAAVVNEPLQHFILDAVSYDEFVAISDALGNRPVRLAYDGERLELMTTSRRHERWKRLLSRLVDAMALTLGIPIEDGGQTTFRSQAAERGLEPDDCFWIQNHEAMFGVDDWAADLHPPPDLAIEVVVSHSMVDRPEIYAKLGVLEVWVFDGVSLVALKKNQDGNYQEIERSAAFPFLKVSALTPFLLQDEHQNVISIVQQFVEWLHTQNFPGDSHS